MHALSQTELDRLMGELEALTLNWFANNRHLAANEQLWRYYLASKKGAFVDIYSRLLIRESENRTVHLLALLPTLSNALTPKIAKALSVSRFKMQWIINMIIYWLILDYSGQSGELPGASESQKLIRDRL